MNTTSNALERANHRALYQRAFFLFKSGWNSAEIARHFQISEAECVELIREGRNEARKPED